MHPCLTASKCFTTSKIKTMDHVRSLSLITTGSDTLPSTLSLESSLTLSLVERGNGQANGRDGHAVQTYVYTSPYTLFRISVYWPLLRTLIHRRIVGHTPYTPCTTYVWEWPDNFGHSCSHLFSSKNRDFIRNSGTVIINR